MKLLVFAHRGEAQIFLKNMALKSHPRINDLYVGEKESLLITGEGITEAISKLAFTLGALDKVEEVINIGICGSFDESIEIGSIFSIAHIYAEDEFKSYPCQLTKDKGLDCITAKDRILTENAANKLKNIAPLVDREIWALAKVAKDFGISISAIKLISDHIKEAVICEYIKDSAEDFSDKLYSHYQNQIHQTHDLEEQASFEIFVNTKFYFTLSMRRSISNTLKSLLSKYPQMSEIILLQDIGIEYIEGLDLLPKQRAKELEEALKRKLYPLKYKISEELENLKREIIGNDLNIKFDESLERPGFSFSTHFSSKEDFEIKVKRLQKFDWKKLTDIFEGKF